MQISDARSLNTFSERAEDFRLLGFEVAFELALFLEVLVLEVAFFVLFLMFSILLLPCSMKY